MRKAFNDQFGEANKKYNALENKFWSTKDDFRRVKSDFETSSRSLKNKDVEVAQIKAGEFPLENIFDILYIFYAWLLTIDYSVLKALNLLCSQLRVF